MAGSNLLQSFWDLSSLEEGDRLIAGLKLLEELNISKRGDSFEQELNYCVSRLITGLASNRKGARHGYFTVLCEVLSVYSKDVSTESVFKLIHDKLECVGNVKASEERGAFIGQLFALLALIQSERKLQSSEIKLLVQKLIHIYTKKVPLRELCVQILLQLLEQLKGDSNSVLKCVLPYMEVLEGGWETCSPDVLLLLVTLEEYFGTEVWFTDFITAHWSTSGHILCEDNFERMAPILLASSQCHPRVHSIWPRLFERFKGTNEWAAFWSIVIEGSLLKSTRERKFLAYQLIEKYVLPSMGVADVGVVTTPTLFRQLHTNTRAVQHSLYEASMHLMNEVLNSCLSFPVLCVGVWLQLIKTNSLFPDYTSQLQSKLTCEGVVCFVDHLITGTSPLCDSIQLLLEQVSCLLKHLPNDLKQSDWLILLARHLLITAHFDWSSHDTSSSHSLNEDDTESDEMLRVKLIQIITELVKMSNLGKHSQSLWSVSIATHIKELLSADKLKFKVEMSSDEEEVWLEAVELSSTLNDKSSDCDTIFLQLISLSSLVMIWDREMALTTTKELILCYKQMITSTTIKKTPRKRKTGPEWIEMLVDIILSLLSRPQQLWPLIIEKCFNFIVPHLTQESFQLIVKALEPQDIEELLMEKGEEGEEEEVMEEEKERGKKSKKRKPSPEVEEKEDEEGEGEDEEGEEDEDNMQFYDPGAEFIASVRDALGDVAAVDSDQESIMSIDDEQMETLDEALSAIFRKKQEKNEQKKQKKINKVTLMQFKMRLLHLVELFIKRNYSNPLILSLVRPLYLLAVSYQTHKTFSSLSDRAISILEKLCKIKKYSREGLDTVPLQSFLEHILTVQLYKAKKTTAPLINETAFFLIKVIKGACPLTTAPSPVATRSTRKRKKTEPELTPSEIFINQVIEWCCNGLDHMITSKNSAVPNSFFQALCHTYPEIGGHLLPTLVSSLQQPGNHFRMMLGYSLSCTLLVQCKDQFSSTNEKLCQSLLSLSNNCTTQLVSSSTTSNNRPILECLLAVLKVVKSIQALHLLNIKELKEVLSTDTISTGKKTQHLANNILQLLDY